MKVYRSSSLIIICSDNKEASLITQALKESSLLYMKSEQKDENGKKSQKGRRKKIDGNWCSLKKEISYYTAKKNNGAWAVYAPSGFLSFIKENIINYQLIDKTVFPKVNIGFQKPVQLRRFQQEAVELSKTEDFGIFEVPTGGGKTILGLSLINEHKTKTLIICDSTEIFNQWIAGVKDLFGFTPDIIKSSKTGMDTDVVIAMSQTLINRPELKQRNSEFGMVIVDECQQIGPGTFYSNPAPIFNSMGTVSQWFSSKKKYGLTDSAIRSDGQNAAIKHAIGQIIYSTDYNLLEAEQCIIKPQLIVRKTEFAPNLSVSGNLDAPEEDYHKLVDSILKDENRNNIIIKDLLKEEDNFCLILANSRKYVRMLAGMLIENNPQLNKKIVVLTSSTPSALRKQAIEDMRNKKINYLFCTALADKGMDIPSLNRLFMVFPGKFEGKKRQQLGRVVRFQDAKEAIVYEYVDLKTPLLYWQFINRFKLVYLPRCVPDYTDPFVEKLCLKYNHSS